MEPNIIGECRQRSHLHVKPLGPSGASGRLQEHWSSYLYILFLFVFQFTLLLPPPHILSISLFLFFFHLTFCHLIGLFPSATLIYVLLPPLFPQAHSFSPLFSHPIFHSLSPSSSFLPFDFLCHSSFNLYHVSACWSSDESSSTSPFHFLCCNYLVLLSSSSYVWLISFNSH